MTIRSILGHPGERHLERVPQLVEGRGRLGRPRRRRSGDDGAAREHPFERVGVGLTRAAGRRAGRGRQRDGGRPAPGRAESIDRPIASDHMHHAASEPSVASNVSARFQVPGMFPARPPRPSPDQRAMTKKLVAIPEGNLLRIAATKSIATLSALKEKTGVDRKTLRAINTGQPVKETTLQAIADKLRVPLAHLLGPSTLDEVENSSSLAPYHRVSSDGFHFREIKLQQLDAAALRRLAGETDQITWLLKIDQMSESLEATLLKLRESLRGWYHHLIGIW